MKRTVITLAKKQILMNLYPKHKYLNISSGHFDNTLPVKHSAGQL